MTKTILAAVLLALGFATTSFASDVYVNGYHRSDGTYVRPYVRSAPNSTRSDNYGPSTNDSQLLNPTSRDYDGDGTANYLDADDDNDGAGDDYDSSQYGR